MVNFTCNLCGDSLKKKDVVLHFSRNLKCRQAASLTCFDCLKEFGEDYVNHTICVTEDQRYSANGLQGVEKTKQQVWSESVHQGIQHIIVTTHPSKSLLNLFEYLSNIPSLPRKEKGFLNLIRNVKKFSDDEARYVWTSVSEFVKRLDNKPNVDAVLKKDKNTPKKSVANGKGPSTIDKTHTLKKTSESAEEVVASKVNKVEDGENKQQKKKQKSKKAAAESSEEIKMDTNEEISSDVNESKKQKKKRTKSESADTFQTNGHSPDATMEVEEQATVEVENQDGSGTKIEEVKLSKKEKKLKKKKEKYEAEMKALEAEKANEELTEDLEELAMEEGKKQKKSKKQTLEAEETMETDKKSKKKRERTVSMAAETEQPKKKNKQKGNDENIEPNEEIQEVVSNRKEFNWADVIIQVLQSQNDNEMSVKRLCKKVVNEYLSSLLEGAHVDEVKATAKFQKKLHKTPGVFVHKDKAKLKASE